MADIKALRTREGLICDLPKFRVGQQHVILSVHDTIDDISWIGVISTSGCSTVTVEVPEPCLSEHTFEINVFLCDGIRSDNDDSSTWRGYSVCCEWQSTVPALTTPHWKDVPFNFGHSPTWDHRITCKRSLQIKSPGLSVQSHSFWQATISWRPRSPLRLHTGQWSWLVSVVDVLDSTKKLFFLVCSGIHHLDLPGWLLKAGHSYKMAVCGVTESELFNDAGVDGMWLSEYAIVYHDAVLSSADLRELKIRAQRYSNGSAFAKCLWLYRNKSDDYFHNMRVFADGVMEPYMKDHSGDPASPINGRLAGLFFMTAPDVDGTPPKVSQFGPVRLQVPTPVMLDVTPNIYFTDFYCMHGSTHYVTLALTKPGSAADHFCRRYGLLELEHFDQNENPFFFRRYDGYYVDASPRLVVELFYTEDLDVNELLRRTAARITRVKTVGRGSSTPGGIPKNAECSICNLPRPAEC